MGRFCTLDPSGGRNICLHLTDGALRCAYGFVTRSRGSGGGAWARAVMSLWLSAGAQEGTRGAAYESPAYLRSSCLRMDDGEM